MAHHDLKTWPEFFQAIIENRKPFEYRLNDRDYKVDDVLHLQEWVPAEDGELGVREGRYTGREVWKRVSYVLPVQELGPAAGVRVASASHFVIMGLDKLHVGPGVDPAPWVPMSNPKDIKVTGKALEELGEAVAALARCLIQGIDATEPSSGKPNKEWAQDELADVNATSYLLAEHFELDKDAIMKRRGRKIDHLKKWFEMMASA
jgi:hypothetical protein